MMETMTRRDLDAAVARLASRQHNVFTRTQAMGLGASSSLVDRRLTAGLWVAEANGVYGLPGAVHTWHRRLMVAHLDLGHASVVSHRAAAALLTLPAARRGAPELTVPRGSGRPARWRVHEIDVAPADRTRVEGIPVTTVVRTVLDLAPLLDRRSLQRLVEELLVQRRLQLDSFTARAAASRSRGRRGSGVLADLLGDLGPGYVPPASEMEARLFAVLAGGGLPCPVRQHPLPSLTGEGRVDAAYPAVRLLVEADGRRWHTRVADFERDRRRDIEAGLLGWRVVRFVWRDLLDEPSWVCQVVGTHLQRAAAA